MALTAPTSCTQSLHKIVCSLKTHPSRLRVLCCKGQHKQMPVHGTLPVYRVLAYAYAALYNTDSVPILALAYAALYNTEHNWQSVSCSLPSWHSYDSIHYNCRCLYLFATTVEGTMHVPMLLAHRGCPTVCIHTGVPVYSNIFNSTRLVLHC